MEHLKCLKQSFKIFKPEVLKATSFKRWNETVFQNFCDTYWLSKMLFKNICINPILKDKVLTILSFQEAATEMCSAKKVLWKFQAKFFKSICNWAYILWISYESGCFWNFVCFLIVQKNQAVTSPLLWIRDWSLHRNHLFEKILHVNELPNQEGFIEDFV